MTTIGTDNARVELNGELLNAFAYASETGGLTTDGKLQMVETRLAWKHNGTRKTQEVKDLGTSGSNVIEALRAERTSGGVGYLPLAPIADAAYPEIRFQHNGSVYGLHDSTTVSTGGSTIPNSIAEREPDNVTTNGQNAATGLRITTDVEWPDKIGAELSSNYGGSSGTQVARIYRVSDGTKLGEQNIDGLVSGDTFSVSLNSPLQPDDGTDATKYNFVVGNDTGAQTAGFRDVAATSTPYNSNDGNLSIVASGLDAQGGADGRVYNLKRVGDVGLS